MTDKVLITDQDDWMRERLRHETGGERHNVYIQERLVAEFTNWVERRSMVTGFKVGIVVGLGVAVVVLAIVKLFT
jgi:hypothetical protein